MTINTSNKNLYQAKNSKKDEFYTQLSDIEKELRHYKKYFKDKVVFCNCDDPRVSNFFHYFSYNFEHLGLKKLITTCYKNQNPDLFSQNKREKAIYIEYKRDTNGQLISYIKYMKSLSKEPLYKGDKDNPNIPNPNDIGIKHLKGDGDFRSAECIELLKQVDIVVTNPPFSLFREYVAQLMEYDKKFIIIGNLNAITYKEIFKLIKEKKIWLGQSIHSGDREFGVPKDYPLNAASGRIDDNGNKYIRVKGVRWFTNFDTTKRHEDLILYKTYKGNEKEYPTYDNYDAINIDKTKEIPMDYKGAMGVPITFMDKYNPEQFEIIGIDRVLVEGLTGKVSRFRIDGKEKYARVIIKNKKAIK